LLARSKRALVLGGYQITNADDAAGVISTAPRSLRVTPAIADCGTTMSLDYLLDNRTDTRVAFGILAADGKLTIRTTIEGQYKPGSAEQNITLTCVSRGSLDGGRRGGWWSHGQGRRRPGGRDLREHFALSHET
jgi:hypothetical protein